MKQNLIIAGIIIVIAAAAAYYFFYIKKKDNTDSGGGSGMASQNNSNADAKDPSAIRRVFDIIKKPLQVDAPKPGGFVADHTRNKPCPEGMYREKVTEQCLPDFTNNLTREHMDKLNPDLRKMK